MVGEKSISVQNEKNSSIEYSRYLMHFSISTLDNSKI